MKRSCPIVGIDVGKEFSYYCVFSPDGEIHLKPFRADNNNTGLSMVVQKIKKVAETFGTNPAIVLESTGHYSLRLVHLFIREDFKVYLINPLQSNSNKGSSIRKVKTDKLDCMKLAALFFQLDLKEFNMGDYNLANLKILTRAYHHLAQQRTKNINQLVANVDQVWPGFTKIFKDPAGKTALCFLLQYPSPACFLKEDPKEVITLIMSESKRGQAYAAKKYELLAQCAKDALNIGIQMEGFFSCIEVYATSVQQINDQLTKMEASIEKLAITIPNVELLKSIPGIGKKLAPVIAAEIGDIQRFKNAKQLVAYCGVDPSVRQSGNFVGTHNKLSKRGSPYVRKALYIAATVAIRKDKKGKCVNPVIYDYYHEKTKSKPKKKALGAIMNKLIRIIFSVLKNERAFILITPEEQRKLYAMRLNRVA